VKGIEDERKKEIDELKNSFSQALSSIIQGYEKQINSLLEVLRQREEGKKIIQEQRSKTMEEGVKRMARIIANSTPDDAVKIILSMSEDIAAQVLNLVEERKAAKILSLLPQDKAKKITDIMFGITPKGEEKFKKPERQEGPTPKFFSPQSEPEEDIMKEGEEENNLYQKPQNRERKKLGI